MHLQFDMYHRLMPNWEKNDWCIRYHDMAFCIHLSMMPVAWWLKCTSDALEDLWILGYFVSIDRRNQFSQHSLWLKFMWQNDTELAQMSYWCSDPEHNMWSTCVLYIIMGLHLTHWPQENGGNFPQCTFQCILLNANVCVLTKSKLRTI